MCGSSMGLTVCVICRGTNIRCEHIECMPSSPVINNNKLIKANDSISQIHERALYADDAYVHYLTFKFHLDQLTKIKLIIFVPNTQQIHATISDGHCYEPFYKRS